MAFISSNKIIKPWEQCDINGCSEEANYLKDEETALCKQHGSSKIALILQKKELTIEDKKILKKYLLSVKPILIRLQADLKKILKNKV